MLFRLMCIEICIVLYVYNLCLIDINRIKYINYSYFFMMNWRWLWDFWLMRKFFGLVWVCNVFLNWVFGFCIKRSVMEMEIYLLIMDG